MKLSYKIMNVIMLSATISLLAFPKRDSKRYSDEFSKEMTQLKLKNLVSSHTAAFSKDNLIKTGVEEAEFQGWENALNAIVDDTPFTDDFKECSMEMRVMITQLHLKLTPMFIGEEVDQQDMTNFLHEKQIIINKYVQRLESLSVQDNELFKNVKDFEVATFNKLNKEINKILLHQSKTITTVKSDLPLTKKGLTVVKKSELEIKIGAIKKNSVKADINDAFKQVDALCDQLKSSFGFWLDSEYIEIPEYTVDNQQKYLEKIKIAESKIQIIQATLMSLQLGKLDDAAKQVVTDLLNVVTNIKRELSILQSTLRATKIIE